MLNPLIDRRNISRSERALLALVALLALLPLAAVRLPAQDAGGKFGGIISDPSGMPIANATVIMNSHKDKSMQMTTSTQKAGTALSGCPRANMNARHETGILRSFGQPCRRSIRVMQRRKT